MRALEIGPGCGVYVPLLKEVCAQVWVSDREQEYLNAIEQQYAGDDRVHVVVDDITQSRLPEDYFDLVLCTEVIEHIADSAGALRHIARVIRPGGILVLSTPQPYSFVETTARIVFTPWLTWLARVVYRESIGEMGHINLMTEREVQTQIAAAGLQVVERYKSGLYLPLIAELLGNFAQHLAAYLEPKIRRSRLEGVLWTQYYVATYSSTAAE
jgi:2-polyprenyl-3-methyl-5-hydroxy-6-metoxy-1,4-benzoquinol methylase